MEDFKITTEELPGSSGILSKDAWLSYVRTQVSEAQKNKQEVSVVIIDIDNMKAVNDTLGHFSGDDVIYTVGDAIELIQKVFRTQVKEGYLDRPLDILKYIPDENSEINSETPPELIPMEFSKLGGDEFGVICFAGEDGVKKVVERLRQAFTGSGDERLKALDVDLAIGTSTLRSGMTYRDILNEADRLMYEDKLSHLPDLTPDQEAFFRNMSMQADELGIKKRNIIKYLMKLDLLDEPQNS